MYSRLFALVLAGSQAAILSGFIFGVLTVAPLKLESSLGFNVWALIMFAVCAVLAWRAPTPLRAWTWLWRVCFWSAFLMPFFVASFATEFMKMPPLGVIFAMIGALGVYMAIVVCWPIAGIYFLLGFLTRRTERKLSGDTEPERPFFSPRARRIAIGTSVVAVSLLVLVSAPTFFPQNKTELELIGELPDGMVADVRWSRSTTAPMTACKEQRWPQGLAQKRRDTRREFSGHFREVLLLDYETHWYGKKLDACQWELTRFNIFLRDETKGAASNAISLKKPGVEATPQLSLADVQGVECKPRGKNSLDCRLVTERAWFRRTLAFDNAPGRHQLRLNVRRVAEFTNPETAEEYHASLLPRAGNTSAVASATTQQRTTTPDVYEPKAARPSVAPTVIEKAPPAAGPTSMRTALRPITEQLSPDTSVHWVGVYESKNRRGHVDVTVLAEKRPRVLALSAYEPVEWRVSLETGAHVEYVILSGYHAQTVTGLPADTVVLTSGYDEQVDPWFYAYKPDGQEHARAYGTIRWLTGRLPDDTQHAYGGEHFRIGTPTTVQTVVAANPELQSAGNKGSAVMMSGGVYKWRDESGRTRFGDREAAIKAGYLAPVANP